MCPIGGESVASSPLHQTLDLIPGEHDVTPRFAKKPRCEISDAGRHGETIGRARDALRLGAWRRFHLSRSSGFYRGTLQTATRRETELAPGVVPSHDRASFPLIHEQVDERRRGHNSPQA